MNSEIEQAYEDWQQAINIFNNAVEKEDIEFAIYNLEAKKRFYMRLLHKAQNSASEIHQKSQTQSISNRFDSSIFSKRSFSDFNTDDTFDFD